MNTQNSKPHQRSVKYRLLFILGCAFLILTVAGCLFGVGLNWTKVLPKSVISKNLSVIKEGELREDATKKISDAWHHGECKRYDGGIDDVYLFGPKTLNQMDILVITSRLDGGVFRVTRAFSEDRDVLKEFGYDKCIPAWILTPVASPSPVSNNARRFGFA